jgi:hypothetical protein
MRKRFLVLSCVAAMSLASLAGAASASTTVTTTVKCWGAFSYSSTSTLTVEQLPPGVTLPYTKTYSFWTYKGLETCTLTVSAS